MPIIPLIGYKVVKDHMEAKQAATGELTPDQAAALQSGQQPHNLTEYQARVIAAAQAQHASNQGRSKQPKMEQTNQMSR